MRLVVALVLLFASAANAFEPAPFVPNVVDQSGTLSADEIRDLNERIRVLRDRAGISAAVYLVKTIGDESIESVAETTFRRWELGEKGKDNGLLFLFALDDRNSRIEVGYGLEGDVTDAHSKRLLDDVIHPRFKTAEFAKGIAAGLQSVGYIKTKDESFLDPSVEIPLGGEELLAGSSASNDVDFARGFFWWKSWVAFLFLFPMAIHILRRLGGTPLPGFRTFVFGRSLFVRLFLIVNPGIFVAFLGPKFADVGLPWLMSEYAKGTFDRGIRTLMTWIAVILLVHPVLRIPLYLVGTTKSRKNPIYTASAWSKFKFLTGLDSILGSAIVCFLAAVLSVILMATEGDTDAIVIFGSIGGIVALVILGYQWVWILNPLLSDARYTRMMARRRLNRIKTRVYGQREIFGKSYNYSRPSSSSGGSGGGFKSSSGGGRSGGGGASSRW